MTEEHATALLRAIEALQAQASRPARGDVLSPSAAARALPWRDSDAAAWLRQQGLVHTVAGCRVVLWSEVLDAIAGEAVPVEEEAVVGW